MKTCHENINKDGEWSFTYLQVVPAFSGVKQVMTSDIIKCTFIPLPGLQIKRTILPAFVSNKLTRVFFWFMSHFTCSLALLDRWTFLKPFFSKTPERPSESKKYQKPKLIKLDVKSIITND